MKPILTSLDLSTKILELKAKKQQQEEELKLQFSDAMHTISPGNLIKTGFNSLTHLPISGPGLITTGLNIGVDLLSRKVLGSSGGTVKNIATQAVKYGLNSLLGRKSNTVKAYATVLFNRILKGNKNKKEVPSIDKP